MFEGSDNIPRGKIDKYISGAGGNLNASTSFDQTDYYFNLPSNQYKLALWIESERMMHAKVDEVGVETQRQVVKEEKRRGVDNQPYGTLFEQLSALVFKGTPYEWVPIGSFQNTKFTLAELATEVEIGQTFIDRCALALNRGELSAEEAAMAKWWCTELQGRVVDRCLQLHGGYGYMNEFPIAKAFVDARVTTLYGGTTEIMKEIIGRSLDLG